ncbi:MAG: hypothetical protein S4CHLAM6_08650 [Chlamydiae bacterium]|nr:hypothetical protein [Chlamydiota bacterium]
MSKDIQELGHLQQLVNQLQPANAELDEKLANSAKVLEQAVKENGDLKLQHLSELEAMQEKLDNCANVLEQAVKENGALKLQHSSELKAMQEKLDALKTKANTQG